VARKYDIQKVELSGNLFHDIASPEYKINMDKNAINSMQYYVIIIIVINTKCTADICVDNVYCWE